MRKALLAACCLLASACKKAEPAPTPPPQQQPVAEAKPLPPGLDGAAINEQANSCEDLYDS